MGGMKESSQGLRSDSPSSGGPVRLRRAERDVMVSRHTLWRACNTIHKGKADGSVRAALWVVRWGWAREVRGHRKSCVSHPWNTLCLQHQPRSWRTISAFRPGLEQSSSYTQLWPHPGFCTGLSVGNSSWQQLCWGTCTPRAVSHPNNGAGGGLHQLPGFEPLLTVWPWTACASVSLPVIWGPGLVSWSYLCSQPLPGLPLET